MKKERKSKSFLDKPYYEGGNKALSAFVDQNLKYPKTAKDQGIKGTVVIKYTINYQGEVIETKVVSGIGHGCDEEAQRVVSLLKFQVGSYRNIKVQFHKTIKIHFHAQVVKVAPEPKSTAPRTVSYSITAKPVSKPSAKPKVERKQSYSYTISIK